VTVASDIPEETNIQAGLGSDTVNGGPVKDTIYGGLDDAVDTLHGGGGDDELHGGAGDDVLYGGEGEDRIYGDDGHDKIYGGNLADHMWGGAGNDFFYGVADGYGDTIDGGGEDPNAHPYGDSVDSRDAEDSITDVEFGAD
jgi:Ca2+-binding RTX toxin-like protein